MWWFFDSKSGLAFLSGACDSKRNVALIKDMGDFDGILTAAHELAHL